MMHTPGPWISDISNVYIVRDEKWAMVADCQSGKTISYPESKTNARLIAEAPAMLEALRLICRLATNAGRAPSHEDALNILLDLANLALEAIRKAKGG